MGDSIHMQIKRFTHRVLLSSSLLLSMPILASCSLMSSAERVLYDQQGIRIGLEPDPTLGRPDALARNNHPAELNQAELETLLHTIQVSGWSGTIAGILDNPRPVPLFTSGEMEAVRFVGPSAPQTKRGRPSFCSARSAASRATNPC